LDFVTKKRKSIEDRFPEFDPGLEGLKKAYSICLPEKPFPEDAYDKIWCSFEYLNGERLDLFIRLFESDSKDEKSKFSNRGFYKKNGLNDDPLDFEEYLGCIIEVLIFSQNHDNALRKQIERYYEEKNKKILKIQDYRLSKVAELASYVIYTREPRQETDGSQFEAYARISIRHCFEVLKAVFDEALGVRLDVFNNLNNFEDTLRKHLAYFPPGSSPILDFEIKIDPETKFTSFKRVPKKLSQKPT